MGNNQLETSDARAFADRLVEQLSRGKGTRVCDLKIIFPDQSEEDIERALREKAASGEAECFGEGEQQLFFLPKL